MTQKQVYLHVAKANCKMQANRVSGWSLKIAVSNLDSCWTLYVVAIEETNTTREVFLSLIYCILFM
jgi:hypothetical protein